MYVNPFWFGVLMTLFALMVVVMIIGFAAVKRAERWEEENQGEEDDQKEESDKRD